MADRAVGTCAECGGPVWLTRLTGRGYPAGSMRARCELGCTDLRPEFFAFAATPRENSNAAALDRLARRWAAA